MDCDGVVAGETSDDGRGLNSGGESFVGEIDRARSIRKEKKKGKKGREKKEKEGRKTLAQRTKIKSFCCCCFCPCPCRCRCRCRRCYCFCLCQKRPFVYMQVWVTLPAAAKFWTSHQLQERQK